MYSIWVCVDGKTAWHFVGEAHLLPPLLSSSHSLRSPLSPPSMSGPASMLLAGAIASLSGAVSAADTSSLRMQMEQRKLVVSSFGAGMFGTTRY